MGLIKNAILAPIQQLVGAPAATTPTVLDDANVSLVLGILEIARRALAVGATGGWFQGVLENVHSAGDSESSSIDPYNAGADAVAPYPAIIGLDLDLWILGISGRRSSGAGGAHRGSYEPEPARARPGVG